MKLRKTPTTYNCVNCQEAHEWKYSSANKFCNNACQQMYQRNKLFEQLISGDNVTASRPTLRRLLIWKHGAICYRCKLSEWQGYPIPLELDHMDGDASNNCYSNLQVVCPNCHGVTETWKGRNRGNGRKSRGLPLS